MRYHFLLVLWAAVRWGSSRLNKRKYLYLVPVAISGPVLDLTKQHKLFLRLISPMVFVTAVAFIFLGKNSACIVFFFFFFFFLHIANTFYSTERLLRISTICHNA
jgi:hypothetical protein